MSELVEFLKARVAEDEEVARAAIQEDRPGSNWRWESSEDDSPFGDGRPISDEVQVSLRTVENFSTGIAGDLPAFVVGYAEEVDDGGGRHIARHDPARVLREITAKRRIIEDYQVARSALDQTDSRGSLRAGSNAFFVACLALASVYSDHPDFSERWAI